MESVLESIREFFGGGTLTIWLVVGAIVALWLALKAAKMAMRIVSLAIGGALLLSSAPWAGAGLDSPVADCVAEAVGASASGWQTTIAKRITVEEASSNASCRGDGQGLSKGSAVAKLRTFFDLPFETFDITPEGAAPRGDLPIPEQLRSSGRMDR